MQRTPRLARARYEAILKALYALEQCRAAHLLKLRLHRRVILHGLLGIVELWRSIDYRHDWGPQYGKCWFVERLAFIE